MVTNEERVQRYRDAAQSDYCGCGACEAQLAAVIAVADAEQAELRAKVERLNERVCHWRDIETTNLRRRLARVEAVADDEFGFTYDAIRAALADPE